MNPSNQSNNSIRSNYIQSKCSRCDHPFIGNVRIGTSTGLICIDCYAPVEIFNEKLTNNDKRLLKSYRISHL